MSRSLEALIGGAVGAVTLVGIVVILLWFWLLHKRRGVRTPETGSSDQSIQAEQSLGIQTSFTGGVTVPSTLGESRSFQLEELRQATKNFSDINLIGKGSFGDVYKGLLQDGSIAVVKKRIAAPTQKFVEDVRYLSSIHHRNVVNLLGYCQENNQQMLVYEYIPNGSVSSHLYGASMLSDEKLEFKHRLSIALAAAKGLAYLHSLSPPFIHKSLTTKNVLVDENFTAKVADAGIKNFFRTGGAGPSSQLEADDIFLDPEVREYGRFSVKSDVYSFGVFLLELVSGREATILKPASEQTLVEWFAFVKVNNDYQDSNDVTSTIIDTRLINNFTDECMRELMQLMVQCMSKSSKRRPDMNFVVSEIDRILEKEISLTIVMGERTPMVTLGSQLFTAQR